MQGAARDVAFRHRHLLGIEGLSPEDIKHVLDVADGYVELNRQAEKKRTVLRGRTIINCFFENSTRTRTSFEVAGKRLGGEARRDSPSTGPAPSQNITRRSFSLGGPVEYPQPRPTAAGIGPSR